MSNMSNIRNRDSRGFTLIELLVVISIIGLLMALLLPVLAKSRNAAQLSRSLSNARQITLGLLSYAADSNSSLPYGRNATRNILTGVWSETTFWPEDLSLSGYIQDKNIYRGPQRIYDQAGWSNWHWAQFSAYASNSNAMPRRSLVEAGSAAQPLKLDNPRVPQMGKWLGLVESWTSDPSYALLNQGVSGVYSGSPWNQAQAANAKYFNIYTYTGMAVTTYLDGHGATATSTEVGWISGPNDSWNGIFIYPTSGAVLKAHPWMARWWQ